jgi:hypothetical protein
MTRVPILRRARLRVAPGLAEDTRKNKFGAARKGYAGATSFLRWYECKKVNSGPQLVTDTERACIQGR